MTKNITLAIDETVLEKARVIAALRRTTVNGMVREFLTGVTSEEARLAEARRELIKLAQNSQARIGPDYKWNREELYEDRVFPRHKHSDLRGGGKTG
jgi:hypothetical protein